jgi:hypothetical protein
MLIEYFRIKLTSEEVKSFLPKNNTETSVNSYEHSKYLQLYASKIKG